MKRTSIKHIGNNSNPDTTGVNVDWHLDDGIINLGEIFGNLRPVELEVGTGKGTFLLERAKARPEINFLGLEYAKGYCDYAADRFRRQGLSNIRMVCADAAMFCKKALGNASLFRLHVFFPDPWPKRKHNRRRLLQPVFISETHRLLQTGGQLLIATDHSDYASQIRAVLENAEGFSKIKFPKLVDSSGLVGTNFEKKYIAEGRTIYSFARLRI